MGTFGPIVGIAYTMWDGLMGASKAHTLPFVVVSDSFVVDLLDIIALVP